MTKVRSGAAAVVLALAIMLTGCGSPGSSSDSHNLQVAGCKAAMRHLAQRVVNGSGASGPPAKEPEACKGLAASTLRRLFREVMREALNGG